MSDKLKNLVVRTVSGIGLTVVVLGGMLWSQWSLGAVLLLLLVGGMWEFYNLSAKQAINPQRFLGLLAGVLLFALNFAFVSNDIEVLGAASRLFAGGLAMLLLLVPLIMPTNSVSLSFLVLLVLSVKSFLVEAEVSTSSLSC